MTYRDAVGVEITLGARVVLAGEHPVDEATGTVVRLIEFDLGQPEAVEVRFDDGEIDAFNAARRFEDDDLRVDDVVVIVTPPNIGDWVRLIDAPEHPVEMRRGEVKDIVDGLVRVWHPFEAVTPLSAVRADRLRVENDSRPDMRDMTTDGAATAYAAGVGAAGARWRILPPAVTTPDVIESFVESNEMRRR